MADQAPAAVGETAPADLTSRIEALFGDVEPDDEAPDTQQDEPEAEQEVEAAPDDQATESDEPTAEDVPEEAAPAQSSDTFEIEWQGQKRALSRQEMIEHAQKGFDYTQKTQQLADERTRLQTMASALQQTAQLQQAVIEEIGEAKAIARELGRFPKTPEEWDALSQQDPLGAFSQRTRYDALIGQYQQLAAQIQHKQGQLKESQGAISAEQLRAEFGKLHDRIPAWRDPDAFKRDAAGIRAFLVSEGYGEQEVSSLTDARALGVAYKAWKYDQLVKAKADKLKQVQKAPPVVKPGVASTPQQTQRAKENASREAIKSAKGEKAKAKAIEAWLETRM